MSNNETDDQRLEILRQTLRADPANLDIANRYWKSLAVYKGKYDIRCGQHIIEAYREAALRSREGVIAFANAYRELFSVSGEGPRPAYFDKDSIRALQRYLPELQEIESSTVQWILQSRRWA
jgi:hypothetical protein